MKKGTENVEMRRRGVVKLLLILSFAYQFILPVSSIPKRERESTRVIKRRGGQYFAILFKNLCHGLSVEKS